VRVALRMVSELVLTEKDVVTSVFKDRSDAIGLGSCKIVMLSRFACCPSR